MKCNDVIEPSSSPWASLIVFVKKNVGSTRFYVDYRRMNDVTKNDSYSLPRIDDTLDTLDGNTWFSTLDLKSGYWQVELHSHDKEKTAFTRGEGLCNCDENKTVVNTSLKSIQTSHDVNLRITQAFSHIGKGYSAIEKFCMVMNIDPFSSTTYAKCARRLHNAYTLASENIFAEIHREIKNVCENGAEIADLSVSFDGTWLTQGHTSLIGVGCVIDMLTGYVVDFEVMSKVCFVIALWQKIS
ncbi:retrovirus-related Pol polyprotein from transposon 412 [Trichonephila clavipes]|nr:retrovirus-related Pol polyprotein from transposon 412 [Trichonephila clavipes]